MVAVFPLPPRNKTPPTNALFVYWSLVYNPRPPSYSFKEFIDLFLKLKFVLLFCYPRLIAEYHYKSREQKSREQKMGGKGRDKKSKQFSEHTNVDNTATRRQQDHPPSGSADMTEVAADEVGGATGTTTTTATTTTDDLPPLTWVGKIIIFFGFPLIVGLLGLYAGYLQKREDPTKQLNFDDDFAYPFVLALTLVIVIAFRTGGFTSTKQKPLVLWPKMKKRRKIIHKHVVVGQDPNFDDDDDDDDNDDDDDGNDGIDTEPEKDDIAKKDD